MRINSISTQYQTFKGQNKKSGNDKNYDISDLMLEYIEPPAPRKTKFVDKIPVIGNIYRAFFKEEDKYYDEYNQKQQENIRRMQIYLNKRDSENENDEIYYSDKPHDYDIIKEDKNLNVSSPNMASLNSESSSKINHDNRLSINSSKPIELHKPPLEQSPAQPEPSLITQPVNSNPTPPKQIKEMHIPKPKFGDNPTEKEKHDYLCGFIKNFNTVNDKTYKLETIDAVAKYGNIKDLVEIYLSFGSADEDIVMAALRAHEAIKHPDSSIYVALLLRNGKTENYSDDIILKTLDIIKAHGKFSKGYTSTVIQPVQDLLTHKSEKVRQMAQETLDVIKG